MFLRFREGNLLDVNPHGLSLRAADKILLLLPASAPGIVQQFKNLLFLQRLHQIPRSQNLISREDILPAVCQKRQHNLLILLPDPLRKLNAAEPFHLDIQKQQIVGIVVRVLKQKRFPAFKYRDFACLSRLLLPGKNHILQNQ